MSVRKLLHLRDALEKRIQEIKDEVANIDTELIALVAPTLNTVRTAQAKEVGTVNAVVDGVKVSQTIEKKVTWDQERLAAIYDKIIESGNDPDAWIKKKVSFTVHERDYKDFPAWAQDTLADARTMKPSLPVYKYKLPEEENAE